MAPVSSSMVPLGTKAPAFSLPNTVTGGNLSFDDVKGEKGTLVVFMCNHCPFVMHLLDHLVRKAESISAQGIGVAAISANDVSAHPDDGPEEMKRLAESKNFSFPYLYDESQDAAKAYRAACTPDFFLYDSTDALVYRGQYDSSRPEKDIPVTGEYLGRAVEALVAGKPPLDKQMPSIGCGVKWK